MPRAHLSKRLDDAAAIQLFAEHHIVQVRRRKNGEIVGVKHATFGWMSPQRYYSLQKIHELMPLLQEFIRGGYQAKAWLWSANFSVSVVGVSIPVPFGASLMLTETLNLAEELYREPKDYNMLLIRAYALLGPFGDIIQIIDFMHSLSMIPSAFAKGGEAILSPVGWLFDAINGPSSWEEQIAAAHDASGCGQAYENTKFYARKELAFELANQAESVELVTLTQQWYNKGVSLGCAWTKGTTSWRDLKF